MFNKSFLTNLLAFLIIIIGYLSPIWRDQLQNIGFYGLSGAITNWLAVHMLFEKIPFLYGSGVIPARFEEFKVGIKQLIMQQFFTVENVEKFLSNMSDNKENGLDPTPFLDSLNYDNIFNELVQVIKESSFGGMINMMGGEAALEPLKEPFKEKMQKTIARIVRSDEFKSALKKGMTGSQGVSAFMIEKVSHIVEQRLQELTPQLVKEIVQEMIRTHLGWLVVWGGVFGGLIGLVASFIIYDR